MVAIREAVALVSLLLLLLRASSGATGQSLPAGQVKALTLFVDTTWPNNNFSSVQDPCSWDVTRVHCSSGVVKSVTSLNFSGLRLNGSIPAFSLGNLTSLKNVDLSHNNLTGAVPSDFNQLQVLLTLDLSGNKCDGDILSIVEDLAQLTHLNLSGNAFSSSITANISKLANLHHLDMSKNEFGGTIPNEIGALASLTVFNVSWNNINGNIPASLSNCTALNILDLSGNTLNGPLPSALPMGLRTLAVANNQLSGSLPQQLPSQLQVLSLGFNSLTGNLPAMPPTLKILALDRNNFSGPLPLDIVGLKQISSLSLGNNLLSGAIPPPPVGSALSSVNLESNSFAGDVPKELLSLGSLRILKLGGNKLTGSLANISSGLQVLDVHNNGLGGSIQAFLGEAISLVHLDLSSNGFAEFPDSLSHLGSLSWLELADNEFRSYSFPEVLPDGLLHLSLRGTNLTGSLPETIDSPMNLSSLDLSSNRLNGSIPRNLGDLKSLSYLNLSGNSLEGAIPSDLTNLTSLVLLDLSNNNLSGRIPIDNQWLTFPTTSFSGNPLLCGYQTIRQCPPSSPSPAPLAVSLRSPGKSSTTGIIAGVVSAFAVVLVCGLAFLIWCRVSRAVKPLARDESKHVSGPMFFEKDAETWARAIKDAHSIPVIMFEKPLLSLSFADLLSCTANFSKELQIADGGYGPVYKGILRDESGTSILAILAIKVLAEVRLRDEKITAARIEALAKVKHPNLVALAGYCLVGEDILLIHDYMVNGDLHRWLHELPEGTRNPEDWSGDTWEQMEADDDEEIESGGLLSWPTRHKIALGTARALAFLHHGCSPHVIHRDVKSSNILLDADFDARLIDAGLAGLAIARDTPVIGGTLGYVPPEYGQTWQATTRGDVYSFGVVLLELATGRKPTGHYFHDSYGGNLVGWVRLMIKADRKGQKALDPKLLRRGYTTEMLEVLRIGYLCTADAPAKRPTMQQVVGLLKDCHPQPPSL